MILLLGVVLVLWGYVLKQGSTNLLPIWVAAGCLVILGIVEVAVVLTELYR